MTAALEKPIILSKDSNALIKKAFSKKNLNKIKIFNETVKAKNSRTKNKANISIKDIIRAYSI